MVLRGGVVLEMDTDEHQLKTEERKWMEKTHHGAHVCDLQGVCACVCWRSFNKGSFSRLPWSTTVGNTGELIGNQSANTVIVCAKLQKAVIVVLSNGSSKAVEPVLARRIFKNADQKNRFAAEKK